MGTGATRRVEFVVQTTGLHVNRVTQVMARLGVCIFILIAGLAAFVVRLAIEGGNAMERSDLEFDRGHLRESLLFARRAAALYAPGLPHVGRADARLEAVAKGAEATERRDVAVLAWQSIRTTEDQRHWWIGRPSDRAQVANERLALLLADDERLGTIGDQQQRSRKIRAELASGPRHRVGFDMLQALGFGATLVGIVAVGWAFGPGSKRRWWAIGGGVLASLGAIAWAILLSLA